MVAFFLNAFANADNLLLYLFIIVRIFYHNYAEVSSGAEILMRRLFLPALSVRKICIYPKLFMFL